jgi:VanZ family protein
MRWIPAVLFFSFLMWIIISADLSAPNFFVQLAGSVPYGDKIGHVGLYATLALLLNVATQARQLNIGGRRVHIGVLLTLGFALLEEGSQLFFPSRNFELMDMLADLLGVAMAAWLTTLYCRWRPRQISNLASETDD